MFYRLSTNFKRGYEVQVSELGTLEWDILNPDQLINLEINNNRITSII